MMKVFCAFLLLLAVATSAPAMAQTEPLDNFHTRYFLSTLRSAFGKLKFAWVGSDICSWKGIACDQTKQEVRVVLVGADLSGTFPALDLTQFDPKRSRVVAVNLMQNPKIVGRLRDEWGELALLQNLLLNGTGVSGSIPDSWDKLSQLSVLDLGNTNVCGNLPNWEGKSMPYLTMLNLEGDRLLRGTLSSSFGSFSDRSIAVNLTGTNFCGCMPSTWTGLPLRLNVMSALPNVASPACTTTNQCLFSMGGCVDSAFAPAMSRGSLWLTVISFALVFAFSTLFV